MKHEGLFVTTATVAPVMYLALGLELRQISPDQFRRSIWYVFVWNAIFCSTAFFAIEVVSLLVLSGAMDETDSWRTQVVLWTGGFALLMASSTVLFVVLGGVYERRATLPPKDSAATGG